jgi:hypothetical protein
MSDRPIITGGSRIPLTHRSDYLTGATPFVFGFMAFMMYELEVSMNNFKSITGADHLEDEWCFGQVTIAVFLWIPLCFKIIYFAMRMM